MLWVEPELALLAWWGGVVPLLPALWLVAPQVWRNACPVAALEVAVGPGPGRTLDARASVRAGAVATGTFLALVVARPSLLDRSGPALAAAVAGAMLLAWLRGRTHAVRAGFCNALCPMGPLERIYGQRPLVDVASERCPSCTGCTRRGCPDVAGDKALRQLVGGGGSVAWLSSPHGALTGMLPGVGVGYALAAGRPASWGFTVGVVVAASAGSWLAAVLVARVVPHAERFLPPLLAALAAVAFYQLVAPGWVARWGVAGGPVAVRSVGTATAIVWLGLAVARARRPPRRTHAGPRRARALPVLTTLPG